jgi:hypothetical protein
MGLDAVRLKKLLVLLALYLSGPAFILLTHPEHLPLPLLMVPFLLLFLSIFVTVWLTGPLVTRGLLSGKRRWAVAASVAGLPVLLIVLRSVDQLTVRDVLIAGGLLVGLTWYVRRVDL